MRENEGVVENSGACGHAGIDWWDEVRSWGPLIVARRMMIESPGVDGTPSEPQPPCAAARCSVS